MKHVFASLLLVFVSSLALRGQGPQSAASAQGLSPLAVYSRGEADNVNPLNGNVFLSIPLLSYPQRGHALDFSFRMFYNANIWFTIAQSSSDASPFWTYRQPLQQQKDPIGVYVARTKHLAQGYDESYIDSRTGGGNNYNQYSISETDHSLFVRESNGAKHYYGDAVRQDCNPQPGPCPQTYPVSEHYFPSTDGTGYQPSGTSLPNGYGQPNGIYGPDGVLYTWPNTFETQTDANGNSIVSSASGWTDSAGRYLPGSRDLPGYGDNVVASSSTFEPTPGVPVDPSATTCPSGTLKARLWQVPGVSNSTQTYYLCFKNVSYQTAFNVPATGGYHFREASSSGGNPALLLFAVILPDKTSYTFDYDSYLSLSTMTLPTGGTITYQYQNITFFAPAGSYLSHPMTRVLKTRTVTPSPGAAPEVWQYRFVQTDSSQVSPPTWAVMTTPAGENTEFTYVGDVSGTAASMSIYSGCSPHDSGDTGCASSSKLLKTESYDYSSGTPGASRTSGADNYTAALTAGLLSNYEKTIITDLDPGTSGSRRTKTVPSYSSGTASCTTSNLTISIPPVPADTTSHTDCFGYARPQSTTYYDYGAAGSGAPGSILRVEQTSYKVSLPSANSSLADSFLNLVSSSVVSDGAGVQLSKTTYGYDEAGSPQGAHGNQTSQTRWLRGGTDIVISTVYNSQGMPASMKDGNGNTTSIEYDSSGVFVSKVTHPQSGSIAHIDQYQADSTTGAMLSHIDENNQTTSYSYQQASGGYDPFSRVTLVTRPTTGTGTATESYTYNDSFPWSVSSSKSLDGARSLDSAQVYDGLGRPACVEDLSASSSIETSHDYAGRILSVTNPHPNSGCSASQIAGNGSSPSFRPGGPPVDPPTPPPPPTGGSYNNYARTTISYDALGRKLTQTNPDSTTKQWSYSGSQTTFTDEAANSWSQTLDGLGRMVAVSEPGGNITTYTYDGLNNLLIADQWGTSTVGSAGGGSRSRSFTYDSLSRLITSKNPETGVVTYQYLTDSGGLCSGDPFNFCKKTNARGMGTVYTYDALNRLQTKAYFGPGYQDGAVKTYYYDGSRADGGSAGTGLNQIGRLSSARSWAPFGNGLHDEYQSYDAMGRVTGRTEVAQSESGTGGHSIGMTYDLAGNLTSLTYPDGRVVTQSYDSAGRLNSVTDGNGQKYVSSVSYFPNGTPQTMVFSNDNMSEYTSLNSRLQVCETKVGNGGGPGTLFDRQYFYGSDTTSGSQCNDVTTNNGNLMHVLDSMNSTNSQHYTYDSLNRLTHWNGFSPAGTVRQQSFGYDSFGNMAPASSATAPSVTGLFDANNRLVAQTTSDCLSYDAAGNLTCTGTQNTDAHTYGFNEESELVLAWVAQNSTSNLVGQYSFDSSGTRVRSDNPTAHTWREYTYLNGQVLAEKDNTGNWTDHIYANGKHLARVEQVRPLLHVHGVRTQAGVNQGCGQNFYLNVGSFGNYTARSGDRIVFQQRSILARGGLAIQFSNGIAIAWDVPDQVGNPINYDTPDGNWHTRVVALPQSVNGTSIQAITATTEHQTGVGTYDTWIGDVAIVSADGAVTPLYRGQAIGATSWYNCDSQLSVATEATPVDGFAGTTYYAGDQVGTTQMEFAVDAWPIQRSEFAPFGQELSSQDFTRNRFKFTGKERDTESGLDYFGARYYASSMGRFMSPDWSASADPVPYARMNNPQSLNLYAYIGNNPLSRRDGDGHSPCGGSANITINVNSNGTSSMSQTADCPDNSSWIMFAGLIGGGVGHHYIPQSISNGFNNITQKFSNSITSGPLVDKTKNYYDALHRAYNDRVRAIIQQYLRDTGKNMKQLSTSDIKAIVQKMKAAGGEIEEFNNRLNADESPMLRNMDEALRDGIETLGENAGQAIEETIEECEAGAPCIPPL